LLIKFYWSATMCLQPFVYIPYCLQLVCRWQSCRRDHGTHKAKKIFVVCPLAEKDHSPNKIEPIHFTHTEMIKAFAPSHLVIDQPSYDQTPMFWLFFFNFFAWVFRRIDMCSCDLIWYKDNWVHILVARFFEK
jgi:hypothetical protein